MTGTNDQDKQTQLRRKIFQIDRLGAMPGVVWKLLDALADDRTTASRLEKLIEGDPALASKVLSLANSAYYGLMQKVTTINRAVVVMGFQELQLLAVGAGLAGVFDVSRTPAGFDGEGLWRHCLAVSWTARELAEQAGHPVPGEIMVAGLLHDLGKLVLATHLQEELAQIMERVDEGVPYHQAEEELGYPHHLIGSWLAKRWGLPAVHESAIRHHHHPVITDPYFTSTCLVALADWVVKRLGLGLIHESRPLNLEAVVNDAGLDSTKVKAVVRKAERQVPGILDAWGQMISRAAEPHLRS